MSAYADVDLEAIRHNTETMAAVSGVAVCAVVKANGYGHGAAAAAQAARAGGATWLAVASLGEAITAAAGAPDLPILVLSERPADSIAEAAGSVPATVRFTIGSEASVRALAALGRPVRVHLKIDTGMHRMGAEPAEAVAVAEAVVAAGHEIEGVWTHLANADSADQSFAHEQLSRFATARGSLAAAGHTPALVHAANSAGAMAVPEARLDMVRVGIALYGVPPSDHLAGLVDLAPALRLRSSVTSVREVAAQETVSYGRKWTASASARIATVPIGYADGIRRSSGMAGVDVLIGGARCPIVGNVTMDQLMVAVLHDVSVGDEVVLIGEQGDERVTANEIATRLGTIGYEVLTGLGSRIVRQPR